jgi:hypothetical protein
MKIRKITVKEGDDFNTPKEKIIHTHQYCDINDVEYLEIWFLQEW